jgi:hypothetical protein
MVHKPAPIDLGEESPPRAAVPGVDSADRLTIGRLLVLTAGIAVGLTVFAPRFEEDNSADPDVWRGLAQAVAIGLALPAPLFCLPRAFRNRRLGPGGLFALSAGLGAIVLLPAGVIERFPWQSPTGGGRLESGACLGVALSLFGLWYLLAALVAGHAGRHLFRRTTSWVERYGFLLALAWSPLGAWWVYDIYAGVLR